MGTYKNIMEMLVEEEVARQYQALPTRAASYLNSEELVAYALNQLPPLYATSEQGLEYQIQKGRAKFAPQITQAVQRAIAAVRRDPLRRNTPLKQDQTAPLSNVLQQLRQLLRDEDVEWETLPGVVERAIKRVAFRTARGINGQDRITAQQSAQNAIAQTLVSQNRVHQTPVSRSTQSGMASAGLRTSTSISPYSSSPQMPSVDRSAQEIQTESGWDDPFFSKR